LIYMHGCNRLWMIGHVSGYKTLIINQRLARVSLQPVGPVLHKWSADQKRIFNILADCLGIPLRRESYVLCVRVKRFCDTAEEA
jgi:hypothetical protein